MALTDKRIEAPAEDIIDLNIDAIKKQKFRIESNYKVKSLGSQCFGPT